MADAGRFAEATRKNRIGLRGVVNHLKTAQSRHMTTMERKNKLMKGASEEIQNEIWEQLTEVESEVFEATTESRKPAVELAKAEPEEQRTAFFRADMVCGLIQLEDCRCRF